MRLSTSFDAVDLNGDGKLDLIFSASGNIYIYENIATSDTITAASFEASSNFVGGPVLVVGDFDGDGKPDIATITNANEQDYDPYGPPIYGELYVYRNTTTSQNTSLPGPITFYQSVLDTTANTVAGLTEGDFDGDGKIDLVFMSEKQLTGSFFQSYINLLHNTSATGTISFAPLNVMSCPANVYINAVTTTPIVMQTADMNGDGKPDLIIAGSSLLIYTNVSTPGFLNTSSFTPPASLLSNFYAQVCIEDIDGDGKPDITLDNAILAGISIYRNDPNTIIPYVFSVTPLNNSIGTDVTIKGANFGGDDVVYFGATKASVLSASTNQLTVTVPAGATYKPVSVLNSTNGLSGFSLLPFTTTFASVSPNLSPKVDFPTATKPYSVYMQDIDGDGKPDMIVTAAGSNKLSIYRNISVSGSISTASFAPKVDFTTGSEPAAVAIADLDGDGKPDIVVTNYGDNSISVFRNTSISGSISSASLASPVDLSVDNQPSSVAIGDIEGDGKPDIVVTNAGSNTLSIFKNLALPGSITSSSFGAKISVPTGPNPSSVCIADLDGDGIPEILVSNYSSNTVSIFNTVFYSSGVNIPAAFSTLSTGSHPFAVSVGDLDGDGKLDIAVANQGDNTVSIFHNIIAAYSITPSSSFAPAISFSAGTNPQSVTIGDINGDGKPEIITGNYNSQNITIFGNTTTTGTINSGSFSRSYNLNAGVNPSNVVIADVDGDGKTI